MTLLSLLAVLIVFLTMIGLNDLYEISNIEAYAQNEDWITYNDDEITFQHPSSYVVKQEKADGSYLINDENSNIKFTISLNKKGDNDDAKQMLDFLIHFSYDKYDHVKSYEKGTFNVTSLDAYGELYSGQSKFSVGNQYKLIVITNQHDNKYHFVTASGPESKYKENESSIHKLINSIEK